MSSDRFAGSPRQSDFGREVNGTVNAKTVADALRQRAMRTAVADAWRYHIAMGAAGFAGGIAFIVPAVLWLTVARPMAVTEPVGFRGAAIVKTPVVEAAAVHQALSDPVSRAEPEPAREKPGDAVPAPTAAPVVTLSPAASANVEPSQSASMAEALVTARGLMRAGDLKGARAILAHPQLADSGEAMFMLAETYDPNVLAALGIHGMLADAAIARRHYEAALGKGISAAAVRIEALK